MRITVLPSPLPLPFRWFMRITVMTQMYKVISKYGVPRLWPFNWPTLQVWSSRGAGGRGRGNCTVAVGPISPSPPPHFLP